jgi:hypothetical protein
VPRIPGRFPEPSVAGAAVVLEGLQVRRDPLAVPARLDRQEPLAEVVGELVNQRGHRAKVGAREEQRRRERRELGPQAPDERRHVRIPDEHQQLDARAEDDDLGSNGGIGRARPDGRQHGRANLLEPPDGLPRVGLVEVRPEPEVRADGLPPGRPPLRRAGGQRRAPGDRREKDADEADRSHARVSAPAAATPTVVRITRSADVMGSSRPWPAPRGWCRCRARPRSCPESC